jgi:hypothetical protein
VSSGGFRLTLGKHAKKARKAAFSPLFFSIYILLPFFINIFLREKVAYLLSQIKNYKVEERKSAERLGEQWVVYWLLFPA